MSPQHSNREALIDGALKCIEEKSSASITARDISAASGANLGSIAYHFGSKDALVALAMEEGFKRWQAELAAAMGDIEGSSPAERLAASVLYLQSGAKRYSGLVHAFLAALARAPHDDKLREALSRSYAASRRGIAALLGLGDDEAAIDAASLLQATFDGLLIQSLVDEQERLDAAIVWRGIERLATLTP